MKRRRMDPERLAMDVVVTYAEYDEKQLEKIWEYQRYVMECVNETKVSNN